MVETEEHLSKIKWIEVRRIVRASIVVAKKEDQSELKEVIVVVPAKWKFRAAHRGFEGQDRRGRVERAGVQLALLDIPAYAGLAFGTPTPLAPVETKTFIPKVAGWKVNG